GASADPPRRALAGVGGVAACGGEADVRGGGGGGQPLGALAVPPGGRGGDRVAAGVLREAPEAGGPPGGERRLAGSRGEGGDSSYPWARSSLVGGVAPFTRLESTHWGKASGRARIEGWDVRRGESPGNQSGPLDEHRAFIEG